jgi:23S rRNA pseudouridine1911/1915/1917 synthase
MNDLEVLYEDNHILAINKPAGVLTQPSGTDQENMQDACKDWLKKKYGKPGNVFLEAVHRLDKQVRGVVLFAKTSKALARLNASMRAKTTRKFYLALVEGRLKEPSGCLEHYLVHDDYHATIADISHPAAKKSALHYRVIEERAEDTLVEIELKTGRYHQIRAQLAAIGCPIVGDIKYGSSKILPEGRIALHHFRFEIPHPITNEPLIVVGNVRRSF